MDYTQDQEKAINDRPKGNILVSASAGSGKTRVLVDRIIKMVKNHEANIDQLLVVTFTNAAAKEMRQRLQQSLREVFNAANDPQEKSALLKQIQKVPVADITTMDAYCQKLVSRYYYILGIDPNFRILSDQTEQELLKDQAWEGVREALYGEDEDGSFARLTENFSDDRSDDGLTRVVYRMDEFANVTDDPNGWLNNAARFYDLQGKSLINSDFYKQFIKPQIDDFFSQIEMDHFLMIQLAQQAELYKDEEFLDKQLDSIKQLAQRLATSSSWDELRDAINQFSFASFSGSRNLDDYQKTVHKRITEINGDIKNSGKQFQQFQQRYFLLDEKTNVQIMQAAKHRIEKLVAVVQRFREAYRELKAQRHLMEFIDIEHAAFDILNADSDQAKLIQKKLQDQYYEIMVDEYQDNNRLQDAILNKITKPDQGNRFMVGDSKQSIYRFRLADPQMFIDKEEGYPKSDNDNELVSLSENFRSAQNIDNFTNLIFEQVMDKQVGEIDYGKAKLKFGDTETLKNYPSKVSLLIYNNDKSAVTNDEPADAQIEDSDTGQVEIIAQKIRQLLDNHEQVYDKDHFRDITPGDIAIISPTHNSELTMADVFRQYNIDAEITGAKSYLKTTEIQVMMALLSIIDNPFQDIPLVAVLRSPIVSLDENQLAYLRINRKTGDYYQAILAFYEAYPTSEPNDYAQQVYAKLATFLDQLKHFKNVAQQDGLVSLIWDIYNTTGYLDYVGGMPGGYQRQTNLHALYERAADYEKNGFKGLFRFVLFIERMQAHDKDLATASPATAEDKVQVMTIHGSKGLQFPVVFLNDIGKKFNDQDLKGNYIFNDHLGIGISYLNTETREVSDPLQKEAVKAVTKNAFLSEEMRKLYVAMTRAEQQLYLVGKITSSKNKPFDAQTQILTWQSKTTAGSLQLPVATRKSAQNYLSWIGPAISRHPLVMAKFGDSQAFAELAHDQAKFDVTFYDNAKLTQMMGEQQPDELSPNEWLKQLAATVPDKVPEADRITDLMTYQYPHQAATHTTAYQSVSEIKRLFDDPDNVQLGNYSLLDADQVIKPSRYTQSSLAAPTFISGNGKSAPSPTDVGTATHMLLQQINLSKTPTEASVAALRDNLVKQGIILANVADQIDLSGVLKFYQTSVGKRVLANSQQTYREVPFSLLMKAKNVFKNFADGDQRILIHGIIDGYVITEDGVYLFDYKTDHLSSKVGVETIVDRYRGQLELYDVALSNLLKQPIAAKYLYLLADNQLVTVQ
ncbi:helicase-exonuclease AddAB subunit AddA [Lentilactobacillus kisonensis]|uniref:ATP-dependent helicase/nuclease subunit A n=1 Tax=Lentilactobacillus kisonensis DSM 19906 = JCM 15041 TaxID=1423766 RepID=A0A0R1NIZ9_9LACO|nr:helicase-exonuclease AddAB subunit AddA [Lentilactobacillus kisonensis]KRL20246.1 ATP-dependent helicase nuclease subunit A [Lentilactobacillus kisonensis DSM 19906 = JCM 15041]